MKNKTEKELMSEYLKAYNNVYVTECYGTSDIFKMEIAERELNRRGIEVGKSNPVFTKDGEEIKV